jgi:hypothetical protein
MLTSLVKRQKKREKEEMGVKYISECYPRKKLEDTNDHS